MTRRRQTKVVKAVKAWAAYRAEDDFLSLASIRDSEEYVREWLRRTYISGIVPTKRAKARRGK